MRIFYTFLKYILPLINACSDSWNHCSLDYLTFHFIRVKLIIEEIEREEAALREDLYSADRKFAEYYNVCDYFLCTFFIRKTCS